MYQPDEMLSVGFFQVFVLCNESLHRIQTCEKQELFDLTMTNNNVDDNFDS